MREAYARDREADIDERLARSREVREVRKRRPPNEQAIVDVLLGRKPQPGVEFPGDIDAPLALDSLEGIALEHWRIYILYDKGRLTDEQMRTRSGSMINQAKLVEASIIEARMTMIERELRGGALLAAPSDAEVDGAAEGHDRGRGDANDAAAT
jgi:hypothetical protein